MAPGWRRQQAARRMGDGITGRTTLGTRIQWERQGSDNAPRPGPGQEAREQRALRAWMSPDPACRPTSCALPVRTDFAAAVHGIRPDLRGDGGGRPHATLGAAGGLQTSHALAPSLLPSLGVMLHWGWQEARPHSWLLPGCGWQPAAPGAPGPCPRTAGPAAGCGPGPPGWPGALGAAAPWPPVPGSSQPAARCAGWRWCRLAP